MHAVSQQVRIAHRFSINDSIEYAPKHSAIVNREIGKKEIEKILET